MIHTIRELIENKSVLILGYGREGRSSWQRIKEAGSYSRIAIADMNHVQLEEGHPAELICGPDYQKCLDDFDVVFKSPGIVLERERKPDMTVCWWATLVYRCLICWIRSMNRH